MLKKYPLFIWNSNLSVSPEFYVLNLYALALPYAPGRGIRGAPSSELPEPPLHVDTWNPPSLSRIGWVNPGTPTAGGVIVRMRLVGDEARILEPQELALLIPYLIKGV